MIFLSTSNLYNDKIAVSSNCQRAAILNLSFYILGTQSAMGDGKMIHGGKKRAIAFRSNVKLARSLWGVLSTVSLQSLKELSERRFVALGLREPNAAQLNCLITLLGI